MRFEGAGLMSTGDLLRSNATAIWNGMPEYKRQECPQWINGWLQGFKKRHGIKERQAHGESASANISNEALTQMESICTEATKYTADTIYYG